jgi:predicted nucleotidyltransferase
MIQNLQAVETTHDVKILFACEAGSRAFGLADRRSDYDVRFIYVHPLRWYLSIDERKDTIEFALKDGLDLAGWDLRKALRLLRKSNPSLLEWLQSEVVYAEEPGVMQEIRRLAQALFSPKACLFHYLNMAWANLKDPGALKNALYAARAVLAARWIECNRTFPPLELEALLACLPADADGVQVKELVLELAQRKRAGCTAQDSETDNFSGLAAFLDREVARLQDFAASMEGVKASREMVQELDAFFFRVLEGDDAAFY